MANFDWRQLPKELLERYDDGVLGYQAWRQLLNRIRELRDTGEPDPFFEAFDEFLRQLDQTSLHSSRCRIFISHQQADVLFAERIAYLADQKGFEYWLDVHDPLLRLAKQTTLPPLVQSILIAAIIEMALLNCTHGITVQTINAQQSRWIPYEFGRADLLPTSRTNLK